MWYNSALVLNTPQIADIRTRQSCGFFTTIGFYLWPGSAFAEKESARAKATGRLSAVFKYLAAHLNSGRSLNESDRSQHG